MGTSSNRHPSYYRYVLSFHQKDSRFFKGIFLHLDGPALRSSSGKPVLNTLMYTLVPIMAITFMVAIGYWMYRRQRMAYFNEVKKKILVTCFSVSLPFDLFYVIVADY